MFALLSFLFFFFFYYHCAVAAVLTAQTATITAQPALNKRAVTTVGYYSTGSEDGTTLWGTVTYETQGALIGTSGSQFALCASNSCDFGSCSSGTYVMKTTAVACGSASSLTCSSNLLYQDVFDTAPLTNFFCDSPTETGYVLYRTTPTGDVSSIDATSTTDTSPTTIPTSTHSSSVPISTSGNPSNPATSKKSTPIGAIVGGVVGGVAVIGALVIGAIFLIRRKRKTGPPQQPYAYSSPPQQESKPYMGMAVAPPPEKPYAGTVQPYAVEVGGEPAPPQSPVPQYTTNNGAMNELPAQRM